MARRRIIEPPQKTPFNQVRGEFPFERESEIFNRTWWLFWHALADAANDGITVDDGVTQEDLPVEYP